MDGRQHTKWFYGTIIFLIAYLIWKEAYLFIPLAFVSVQMVDPDEDQKYANGKTHRNGFTHSMLYALYYAFAVALPVQLMFRMYLVVFCFPVMIHMLCDLKGENYTGKACIWTPWGRLSPTWSRIFLIANTFIILLIMFL